MPPGPPAWTPPPIDRRLLAWLADHAGLVVAEPGGWRRAAGLLRAPSCLVTGLARRGALLDRPAAVLDASARRERRGDARLFPGPAAAGRCPDRRERVGQVAAAVRLVRERCRERGHRLGWGWCAYRERGADLALEPVAILGDRVGEDAVLAVAGALNQEHIHWRAPGTRLRVHRARRAEDGRVTGYRPVPGPAPVAVWPGSVTSSRR